MKKKLVYLGIILLIVTYLISVKATPGNYNSGESILVTHDIYNIYEYENTPFEFSRSRTEYTVLVSLFNDFKIYMPYSLARAGWPDSAMDGDGKFFSFAKAGLAFFALPFYTIGSFFNLGQLGSALFVGFLGILNVLGIYYITRKILGGSLGVSMLAAFIYGFGTMAWVYSTTFIYHTPVNSCVIGLIIVVGKILKAKDKECAYTYSRYIWMLFGIILTLDNPAFVACSILIPTIFFIIWKYKRQYIKMFIETSVWLLLFLSVTALSQQLLYGNWKEMSNDQIKLEPNKAFVQEKTDRLHERNKEQSFGVVSAAFSPRYIYGNTYATVFEPRKGLFFVHTIFIFSLLGYIKKTRKLLLAFIPFIIWLLLFYGMFKYGDGATSFGPRYLNPTLPLLAILSAFGIVRYKKKPFTYWLSFPLLIFSILTMASSAVSRFSNLSPFIDGYFGIQNLRFVMEDYSAMFIYDFWLRDIMPLWPIYVTICITLSIYAFYLYRFILTEKENDDWQKIDSQS